MLFTVAAETRSRNALDDFWYMPIVEQTSAGVDVSEHNALWVEDVYKCVDLISTTVAAAPLPVYKRLERGKEKATEHPYFWLLRYKANNFMTAFRWRQLAMGHVLTWGNHYSFKMRERSGQVTGLWPIRPDRITPEWNQRTQQIDYVYQPKEGKEQVFQRDRILHLYGFGFDGLVGYSPIQMQRESIGIAKAAREAEGKFFGNGARPDGILTTDQRFRDSASKEQAREDWYKLYGGPDNAHKIAILDGGLDYKAIGLPPKDALYLETIQATGIDICGWYRVPPELVGHKMGSDWGTGVEQRQIAWATYTIEPIFISIEQELLLQLFGDDKDYFCEFLMDNILRADAKSRAEFYRTLFNAGALAPNDIRARENMNPIEGGDVPFVPLNMIPLDMAEDVAESVAEDGGVDQPEDIPEDDSRAVREAELMVARRSVNARRVVADQHRDRFRDAAQKVVSAEVREVKKALKKNFQRDVNTFDEWLRDFYFENTGFIREILHPVWTRYAIAIRSIVEAETELPEGAPQDFEAFVEAFLDTYINRHAANSRRQITKVMSDAIGAGSDPVQAVQDLLDHWMEVKAEQMAFHDVVEGDSAFAMHTYLLAGYRQKVWVAQGAETCPYCKALDGKVISIDSPFLTPDTVFQPDGAKNALTVNNIRKYPPAHNHCDCSVGGIF